MASRLPSDDRAVCMACLGTGAYGFAGDISDCGICADLQRQRRGYCGAHKCRQCDGKGVVCPICRGMRFLRVPRASNGNDIMRCECCEGNNVNPLTEMRLIERHIRKIELSRQPGLTEPAGEETQP